MKEWMSLDTSWIDPKQRKPDISLANKLLDWNPKVHLEEGVSRTIPYFRDLLKIYF